MRSPERIAEDQVLGATLRQSVPLHRKVATHPAPLVTVSREYGAGGERVADALAEALGFTFWDHELLAEIARETGAVESVLASLDERIHSPVSDWIESLLLGVEYSQDEYLRHLTTLITGIAQRGSAVVVGRASHLIVPPERALRVRVVCPRSLRVHRLMERDVAAESEAARRIQEEDHALHAFVRHHFHQDVTLPEQYDLVVNTGTFTIAEAVETIATAYRSHFA